MKTIATHEAKTHLSRYLKEVSKAETIVISRGRNPVVGTPWPNWFPTISRLPKSGKPWMLRWRFQTKPSSL